MGRKNRSVDCYKKMVSWFTVTYVVLLNCVSLCALYHFVTEVELMYSVLLYCI